MIDSSKLLESYSVYWSTGLTRKPKLRLYRELKTSFYVERYVKLDLQRKERSLLCLLRCGALPIKIETGRYVGLKAEERICELCNSGVEDEVHFLFYCKALCDERSAFYNYLFNTGYVNFHKLSDCKKIRLLCNIETRRFAKYIVKLYEVRQNLLYNS